MADSNLESRISEKFKLETLIAEGGMGRVYSATQQPLGRKVALKILTAPNTPEFRERFLREGATTVRLSHRHIVTVHDYGEIQGELYIAMEYLEGAPLSKFLQDNRRLSIARSMQIGLQLCSALRAAHKEGIVHRDLKPSNIMMVNAEDFDGDFVKIIDFGIAKVFESSAGNEALSLTNPGTWVGSPRYMSPEQISVKPVDQRTDVYALGVILFQMVTGRPPFVGTNSHEIFEQHLRSPAPHLSEVGTQPEMSPELELVIERCLEKKPKDRYQNVDELAADLRATLRIMGLSPGVDLSSSGVAYIDSTGSGMVGATMSGLVHKKRNGPKIALGVLLSLPLLLLAWSKLSGPQAVPVAAKIEPQPTAVSQETVDAIAVDIDVRMISTPTGANVAVDGKSIGITPLTHRFSSSLEGKPISVVLTKEGFDEFHLSSVLGQEPVLRMTMAQTVVGTAAVEPAEVEDRPTQNVRHRTTKSKARRRSTSTKKEVVEVVHTVPAIPVPKRTRTVGDDESAVDDAIRVVD